MREGSIKNLDTCIFNFTTNRTMYFRQSYMGNAVYSVVNVPMKVISCPSNGSEENGDILAMLISF